MAIYDLMRWGPTSANCIARRAFVFVVSKEAKERLKPHLEPAMRQDDERARHRHHRLRSRLRAHLAQALSAQSQDAKDWFTDPAVDADDGVPQWSLQGGYFIIAARALGLDCGPMSGFNNEGVDHEFFAGTGSNRISSAISVMAIRRAVSRAVRGSPSTRPARLSDGVKILAVDTALGACSVAVLDDDRVLAHRFEAMERGHAEALAPMVDEVMRERGMRSRRSTGLPSRSAREPSPASASVSPSCAGCASRSASRWSA